MLTFFKNYMHIELKYGNSINLYYITFQGVKSGKPKQLLKTQL